MNVEYSKHGGFAYSFSEKERKTIGKYLNLKEKIKQLNKKIEKLQNHPENEGQVTFLVQIEEHESFIKDLLEIEKLFKE
jgi:hypothetical protein